MNSRKALRLAIARSVPPTTMPGYWKTWQIWLRIARAVGAHRHQNDLLREYQDAAYRASIAADLQRQEDEICGGPAQ